MRWWLAVVLLVPALSGCVETDTGHDDEAAPQSAVLWEQGLTDHYPTPAHAKRGDHNASVQGTAPPGDDAYVQFDRSILQVMESYDVPAGTFALTHNGNLLYASGYGHVDREESTPATPQNMFRVASVSKPITRMLIELQAQEGLYNLTDPVFCLEPQPLEVCRLNIPVHPDHPLMDARIRDITVQQLVDHTAGWGRIAPSLYRHDGAAAMREALSLPDGPVPLWRAAQFMLGIDLIADPGTSFDYCNMCYNLAALVAEDATGATMGALLDAYLFRPLGVSGEIELAKALEADRNPREPFYDSNGREQSSAYDADETVPTPDGGFNLEILRGAGAIVGTASAIATVYGAYPEHVPPRATAQQNYVGGVDTFGATHDRVGHYGLLDGTTSMSVWAQDRAGPSGIVQIVVIFMGILAAGAGLGFRAARESTPENVPCMHSNMTSWRWRSRRHTRNRYSAATKQASNKSLQPTLPPVGRLNSDIRR